MPSLASSSRLSKSINYEVSRICSATVASRSASIILRLVLSIVVGPIVGSTVDAIAGAVVESLGVGKPCTSARLRL